MLGVRWLNARSTRATNSIGGNMVSVALMDLSDEELTKAAAGQLSLVARVTPTVAVGVLNDRYPVLARILASKPTTVTEVIGESVYLRRYPVSVPFEETSGYLFPAIHPTQQKLQFAEAA
jgi:hypothetical protein